jgi:sugar-specific transcriptional regulator TrmB
LGEEKIKTILKNSGVTEKEADIYILLAKQGAMNRGEIATSLKKDKAQVSRILKRLQSKGVVESTLEFPRRFTAIPFETIIDLSIKTKREEVAFIENAKKDLLKYLEKSRQAGLKLPLEKFVVIEGNQRIYSKILDMIRETKSQFSAVSTVSALVRTNEFGLLDFDSNYSLKSPIQFRFLTEFSDQNLNAGKALLERIPKTGFRIRARNPNLGLRLFPRMVIKDDEEILLFITSGTGTLPADHNEVSLWTNCRSIVNSFTWFFDELWRNSTELETRIAEIETGKPTPRTVIIADTETAKEKYEKTLRKAEKEIIMMTSAKNLVKFWESNPPIEDWAKSGVLVKIMAPITKDNLGIAERLGKFCKVRHIALSYLGTTVVDGKHLFQFKMPSSLQKGLEVVASFENTFYTDDFEYVGKVKVMLDDLWKNARAPSAITLQSILQSPGTQINAFSENNYTYSKSDTPYRKMVIPFEEKPRIITEKEVLNKIINAKKYTVKTPLKDKAIFYGSRAAAVIHPPDYLNLPDIIISVSHWNKQSSFGSVNWLTIHLLLGTQKGKAFVPVAVVQDRSIGLDLRKAIYVDTPADKNIQVIKNDEFQVQVYGNILFAGWTRSIPLLSPKYTLPPSCILFEGYGEVKPGVIRSGFPSGRKQTWEYNGFEAFVTFFHPSSKYSGPGTDGTFSREVILTSYPP